MDKIDFCVSCTGFLAVFVDLASPTKQTYLEPIVCIACNKYGGVAAMSLGEDGEIVDIVDQINFVGVIDSSSDLALTPYLLQRRESIIKQVNGALANETVDSGCVCAKNGDDSANSS